MTMHLLPCYFTTTGSGKTKKSKNKRLAKSQAEHQAWVDSMTGGKTADMSIVNKYTLMEYKESMKVDRDKYSGTGVIPGTFAKQDAKVYSGERKLLGIATMHKSNMVPVFADNKEAAVDIARMRRG
jgi:hypothetical protein